MGIELNWCVPFIAATTPNLRYEREISLDLKLADHQEPLNYNYAQ